jgi:hypothetical protein
MPRRIWQFGSFLTGSLKAGYFLAPKDYMAKKRTNDKSVYQDVFYLEEHFGSDRTLRTPADLKSFFEDEGSSQGSAEKPSFFLKKRARFS